MRIRASGKWTWAEAGEQGDLLDAHEPPCLSLYQPTSRHHPDNQQDPIRFRNLVKALDQSIHTLYPTRDAQPLLAHFDELAADAAFWNQSLDGLAVFAAADLLQVHRLQRPVPELALVADSFHIKPLLRILQSADRFQILALNASAVRLFEGNRDAVDEIDLAAGVPRTITDALGEELTQPHQTVASYGGGAGDGKGGGGTSMHHGHGGKKDEQNVDTDRFFRAVDRAVLEHHSRPSGLPLLLAALPEHQSRFRRVSKNALLVAEGIEGSPDAVSADTLRSQGWRVMEPQYLARLARLTEAFGGAKPHDLSSDDIGQVGEAAIGGRVATLLVEADRRIPGRLDGATGAIETRDLTNADIDDVLDDLSEAVLQAGGEVIVVPGERMPTTTGLAAIYRY